MIGLKYCTRTESIGRKFGESLLSVDLTIHLVARTESNCNVEHMCELFLFKRYIVQLLNMAGCSDWHERADVSLKFRLLFSFSSFLFLCVKEIKIN